MSGYEGKSNADIINEQESSLNAKSAHGGSFRQDDSTVLSNESGVSDAQLGEFPSARGVDQVTTGRTGQTGGGTKAQHIPPSEGGADVTGNTSDRFEDPLYGDSRDGVAARAPGSVNVKGDAIDARTVQSEAIRSIDAPTDKHAPQLSNQDESPYNA